MSRNLSEAANGSTEIASNITGVADAAASTAEAASSATQTTQNVVGLRHRATHRRQRIPLLSRSPSCGVGCGEPQPPHAHLPQTYLIRAHPSVLSMEVDLGAVIGRSSSGWTQRNSVRTLSSEMNGSGRSGVIFL